MSNTTLESKPEELGITLDHDRMMVCLEATWEIDAMARELSKLVANLDEEDAARVSYLARATAGRMLRLTSVLMSGLSDETDKTSDLAAIVHLNWGQG